MRPPSSPPLIVVIAVLQTPLHYRYLYFLLLMPLPFPPPSSSISVSPFIPVFKLDGVAPVTSLP
ncbi:hypothetical protein PIB30_091722, partial [Stylosanthes scabra]|nr:hypothetical protein [Stylosanthes scabra]